MRIDDRVREVHLSHYCPGGMGLPVGASGPVGLDDRPRDGTASAADADDHRLSADGSPCGRCGRPLAAGQDVRRLLSGQTVHATCPLDDRLESVATLAGGIGGVSAVVE
jgi:hypothetical protein